MFFQQHERLPAHRRTAPSAPRLTADDDYATAPALAETSVWRSSPVMPCIFNVDDQAARPAAIVLLEKGFRAR